MFVVGGRSFVDNGLLEIVNQILRTCENKCKYNNDTGIEIKFRCAVKPNGTIIQAHLYHAIITICTSMYRYDINGNINGSNIDRALS